MPVYEFMSKLVSERVSLSPTFKDIGKVDLDELPSNTQGGSFEVKASVLDRNNASYTAPVEFVFELRNGVDVVCSYLVNSIIQKNSTYTIPVCDYDRTKEMRLFAKSSVDGVVARFSIEHR